MTELGRFTISKGGPLADAGFAEQQAADLAQQRAMLAVLDHAV